MSDDKRSDHVKSVDAPIPILGRTAVEVGDTTLEGTNAEFVPGPDTLVLIVGGLEDLGLEVGQKIHISAYTGETFVVGPPDPECPGMTRLYRVFP